MIISPIIPIWLMLLICVGLILLKPKSNSRWIRQIIIVILIFCINLRIMIPGDTKSQTVSSDLDVIFVIDNTISMLAADYNGNDTRLSAVKNDCEKIVDELNGARFSVITFSNTAKILMPFTKDANIITESIDIIDVTGELYAKGSTLNVVLDDMVNMLKSSSQKERTKDNPVFYQ